MSAAALQVLLNGWSLQPTVILGILALSAAYVYAVGPLRRRYGWGDEPSGAQVGTFFAGVAIMALALLSPLDTIGDQYLFSAHMVQHMLLTMVIPPLLLLGTPGWLVAVLLRPVLRYPAVRRFTHSLVFPLSALVLFNVDFWIWHAPPLYDLTLRNQTLHALEHLTFLATATVNWLPVLSPLPEELPRLPRLQQVLYLFLNCQPIVVLGALLTFAGQPLYSPYLAAPRIFGLSAATDQQLGGLIMWIPGNFVYLLVMSIIFITWLEQQGAEQDRRDREAWEAEDAAAAAATISAATTTATPPATASAASAASAASPDVASRIALAPSEQIAAGESR